MNAADAVASLVTISDAKYETKWGPTELSSSIVMISFFDLSEQNLDGKAAVPCKDGVDRAKKLNMKSIEFQFSAYWTGPKPEKPSGWCYKNGYLRCEAVTAASIKTLQDGMASCAQYAVDSGFKAVVLIPKIDYNEFYYWRNDLWFNPLDKFDGFSYVDILLTPFAGALNAVAAKAPAGVNFYLALQAETAKSVTYGPRNWLAVAATVKAALTKGLAAKAGAMKIGLAQNNRRVCSCLDTHKIDKVYGVYNYLAAYGKEFNDVTKADDLRFDRAALQYLYSQMDFLAISGYVMVYPGYSTAEMEMSCLQHSLALSFMGINMQQLLGSGKELFIFETGGCPAAAAARPLPGC